MKNKVVTVMLALLFFTCNFGGGFFFEKDVQSVYVEETVINVGQELSAYWVNKPGFSFKDAEWSVSDSEVAKLEVSEDESSVVVTPLKEGSIHLNLEHGSEVVDSVELFFVDDSISEDMTVSVNAESEVSISEFIKITDPEKLRWVSSDESVVSLEGVQRKYNIKPKKAGVVTLTAYYGDTVIGDVTLTVKNKERLPKECILSEDGVMYLDTEYIYSNLNPCIEYNMGKVDAGNVFGVLEGELAVKKGKHFTKSSEKYNLSSYYLASREGKEQVTLKIKDREYRINLKVSGNDSSVVYKDWKKEWVKGIIPEASAMDKVKAIARVTSNLTFDARSWELEEAIASGKINSMGACNLFVDLCNKVGVEASVVKVNYEKFGNDMLSLAKGSSVLNYSVCKFKDGEFEYIVDVTPREGEKNKCYYEFEALMGIYNNLWSDTDL